MRSSLSEVGPSDDGKDGSLLSRISKVSALAGASVFVVVSVGLIEAVSLLVSLTSISSASFALAGSGVSRSVVVGVGVPSSGLEMGAEVDSAMDRGLAGTSVGAFISDILPFPLDPIIDILSDYRDRGHLLV